MADQFPERIRTLPFVVKFGRNPRCDEGVTVDIWDHPTQDIWVPPTAARIHDIVSTSTSDTSAGIGAQRLAVEGLPTWERPEISEIITMNGTTPVSTVNSYVMINRLQVVLWGTSGPNVGDIAATAQVDGTDTNTIPAGFGITMSAILGWPSDRFFIGQRSSYGVMGDPASPLPAAADGVHAEISVLFSTQPNLFTGGYFTGFTRNLFSGSGFFVDSLIPPIILPGPGILKLQATNVTQDNSVCIGGIEGRITHEQGEAAPSIG